MTIAAPGCDGLHKPRMMKSRHGPSAGCWTACDIFTTKLLVGHSTPFLRSLWHFLARIPRLWDELGPLADVVALRARGLC